MFAFHTAKQKKPFGDGEKWMSVAVKMLEAMGHAKAAEAMEELCLSRYTIAKCVDELNKRAEDELKEKIKKSRGSIYCA